MPFHIITLKKQKCQDAKMSRCQVDLTLANFRYFLKITK